MAYIDCVIDTHPMAREIDSVSHHIKGTTAAVIGMKAAVVKAEQDAADLVCRNVNKGFYTLIHSQISQKIAKLQSEVDSHLMRLNQFRKQLLAIRGRMEKDYGMISHRYSKLFTSLNKNLQQRVFELDKPVIQFALKDVTSISIRSRQLTATAPVAQVESLSVSQKILASNMKNRGRLAIESMSSFLSQMKSQNELTDRIMLDSFRIMKDAQVMIPVVISEELVDSDENVRTDIYMNDQCLSEENMQMVRNVILDSREEMNWTEGQMHDEVQSEFQKLLEASTMSERAKKMANLLFHANDFQILKEKSYEL